MYRSTCRNCGCLHYNSDESLTYPERCYCPEDFRAIRRCTRYVPTDNLEYLEFILEFDLQRVKEL